MKLTKIAYQEGWLYVDKKATIQVGDCMLYCRDEPNYWTEVRVKDEVPVVPKWWCKIVAQSPNLSLPNIPYIEEVEEKYCVWVKASDKFPIQDLPESLEDVTFRKISDKSPITNIWAFHTPYIELENNGRICGDTIRYYEIEWLDEAAQSKGRYSEADVRKAIDMSHQQDKDGINYDYTIDDIIQSLNQPKEIEIEMDYFVGDKECNHGNSHITPSLKPVTYQKDGKTFLKVKLPI